MSVSLHLYNGLQYILEVYLFLPYGGPYIMKNKITLINAHSDVNL